MDDVFKLLAAMIGFTLLVVLYQSYGFAQAHNVETFVVFNVALAIIGLSILSIFVAAKAGITDGFCLWLVSCWISLWPLLEALANVDSFGSYDPAWYSTRWFRWGVLAVLATLSAVLLNRKYRRYY